MEEKEEKTTQQELSEEQMKKIAGGDFFDKGIIHKELYDGRGRWIGTDVFCSIWRIHYWPCPKCGKPMHAGTMNWIYCDPCNYKAWDSFVQIWQGTEEELIEAANSAF